MPRIQVAQPRVSSPLIQQVRFSAALNMALTNVFQDIPGASLTFTYDGRPVRFGWRFPYSKYSVTTANQAILFGLLDVGSGAMQYQPRSQAFPTNVTDVVNIAFDTDSISSLVDGTPLVAGNEYVFKLQARRITTDGTWSAAYAANSAFYGHFSVHGD